MSMRFEKPKYNTWIRSKKIIIFLILSLCSIYSIFFIVYSPLFLLFTIPALFFSYIFLIISLSSYRFSSNGGDFQNKIHNLIITFIETKSANKILDIGCGSGNLAIKIAKQFSQAEITGVDYWGKDWQYSKTQCEKNARIEQVEKQLHFAKGTAINLDFKDNHFDNIVSCLTFHEVKDADEKLMCLAEALRVLKPAGGFVFFDLFLDPKFYPIPDKIKEYIDKNNGVVKEIKKLDEFFKLPFPLNDKKVLGYAMLITGTKK